MPPNFLSVLFGWLGIVKRHKRRGVARHLAKKMDEQRLKRKVCPDCGCPDMEVDVLRDDYSGHNLRCWLCGARFSY
jgi:hypothetical protein